MQNEFMVFPAIDLRAGQVVRLKEGDPNRQTQYDSNPVQAAERWLNAGASWLHVVNLDGAFEETDDLNRTALQNILKVARKYNAKVQFGGGLRTSAAVTEILDLGVSRAVLGTVAVKSPEVLFEALSQWGSEQIAVSLDARDGIIQVRGWQESTQLSALDTAVSFQKAGLRWLVFTDISRDGLQTGLNLPATVEIAQTSGLKVIASGGVRSLQDIENAHLAGLAGAITGRALYENTLNLDLLFRPFSSK